jgi:hypothetical protein
MTNIRAEIRGGALPTKPKIAKQMDMPKVNFRSRNVLAWNFMLNRAVLDLNGSAIEWHQDVPV